MDEEGEEAHTMVNQKGLFSPGRVPQRLLDETPHLQSMMGVEVLAGLVEVI